MRCETTFCLLVGSLVLFSIGCGPSGRIETAEVSGTVTFNGQPINLGTVTFESPGCRPATGEIIDGKIVKVTTYEEGDGAAVGTHRVAIFAQDLGNAAPKAVTVENPGVVQDFDPNYMGGGEQLIPERYMNPATSGLTAEIRAGEVNVLSFELSGK